MKAILYVLAGLFAAGTSLITLLVAAVMLFGSGYGERIEINNGEVYYTENVTRAEAMQLVDFLATIRDEESPYATFQLDKRGDDYVYRMCAQPEAYTSNEYDSAWMATETLLEADVFKGSNVIIEVCDEQLQTRKSVDNFQPATENAVEFASK